MVADLGMRALKPYSRSTHERLGQAHAPIRLGSSVPQKLVYLVTEDWAFWRHRLPMARAARDAGFDVHVITNVSDRAGAIRAEGFTLHPLDLARGSLSPVAVAGTVSAVRGMLAGIKPALLHNVAMKPLITGSLAVTGINSCAVVNSINGLGSAYIGSSLRGRAMRGGLELALRGLLNRRSTYTIVQNPEDFAAVRSAGVAERRLVLVPGSGVDTGTLLPLPEPAGETVRVAYVGRMLEDKGLRCLIDAHRLMRARGQIAELVLAGEPDPQNPTSITAAELSAWATEPGVTWLGHVESIADVWAGAHIAVLPSRREGLPKSLLEAAAFGRPSIAADVPGCREIVVHGETGLLFPVDNPVALADAIAGLASDPERRRAMGSAARALTVRRFSSADIGRQTVAVYRTALGERVS
jgi:glycosyltransferase involved in cell wall biosynthesis